MNEALELCENYEQCRNYARPSSELNELDVPGLCYNCAYANEMSERAYWFALENGATAEDSAERGM